MIHNSYFMYNNCSIVCKTKIYKLLDVIFNEIIMWMFLIHEFKRIKYFLFNLLRNCTFQTLIFLKILFKFLNS